MLKLNQQQAIQKLNQAGETAQPFFVLADFSGTSFEIWEKAELAQQKILVNFPNFKNFNKPELPIGNPQINLIDQLSLKDYQKAFQKVQEYLQRGDTYLCNLTFAQKIKLSLSLEDVFYQADARFKIYYPGNFVCFSPEIFVETKNNKIYTYPMKGTFDSEEPETLATNKELAEHATVVDLLRNDLSLVAEKVQVENYRYFEEIKTPTGEKYLQSSSQISGLLPHNWQSELGTIFTKLLPAGSVTGAPKQKTIQVIQEVEQYPRRFYTGTAGYFDGSNFISCVLIRFIEESEKGLVFKSGGGITAESELTAEYQELISKIYVPISGKY